MISDVLSEAISDIEDYLNDVTYVPVYDDEIRKELFDLVKDMEKMRKKLDEPIK